MPPRGQDRPAGSFAEAWQALSVEYDYYGDFQHFVNKDMIPCAGQAEHNMLSESAVEP